MDQTRINNVLRDMQHAQMAIFKKKVQFPGSIYNLTPPEQKEVVLRMRGTQEQKKPPDRRD